MTIRMATEATRALLFPMMMDMRQPRDAHQNTTSTPMTYSYDGRAWVQAE